MTTLVELECPAETVGLARTFAQDEAFSFAIDGMIGDVPPLVWTTGTSRRRVSAALEADPSVELIASLATLDDDRWLYRLAFGEELSRFEQLVSTGDGAIVSASGQDGSWSLELLFHDHESVSVVHERLAEDDFEATVRRVTSPNGRPSDRTPLTETQYETIVAAHEHGFFDVPRNVTLQELAEELDVSHQALSERLRRSHAALVSAELSNRLATSPIER